MTIKRRRRLKQKIIAIPTSITEQTASTLLIWRKTLKYSIPLTLCCLINGCAQSNTATLAKPNQSPNKNRSDAMMLGDSLTYMGKWGDLLKGCTIINLGVGGNTVAQMRARIPDLDKTPPEAFFIMGGTNDIAQSKNVEATLSAYQSIVDYVKPHTLKIFIQQIPHVSALRRGFEEFNMKIDQLNLSLKLIAKESNITFVPTKLDEPNLKEFRISDGVHLTEAGYEVWAAEIKPLLPCSVK